MPLQFSLNIARTVQTIFNILPFYWYIKLYF